MTIGSLKKYHSFDEVLFLETNFRIFIKQKDPSGFDVGDGSTGRVRFEYLLNFGLLSFEFNSTHQYYFILFLLVSLCMISKEFSKTNISKWVI